jgi:hypothetical protein
MKMQNLEPATIGGGKKANGHKATCKCPICVNMMAKKKGGSKMQNLEPATIGGGKKANGHKAACKCPICLNMKHQKASKKNRRVTRPNRTRRGGADGLGKRKRGEDSGEESEEEYEPEEVEPQEDPVDVEVEPQEDHVDLHPQNLMGQIDNAADANGVAGPEDAEPVHPDEEKEEGDKEPKGGRRKKRKGNGHKPTCKCPICKNMRMKKGGVKSPYQDEKPVEPTPAGEGAQQNVGGSRRRKRGKSRRTRKIRRRR